MTVRSSLGSLFACLLASLLAAGCSSAESSNDERAPRVPGQDESVPSGDEEIETSEDALGADCTYSRKWYASLSERACAPVAGYRGKWVPSPLFADSNDPTTCTYTWQGEKYSRADQTALQRSVTEREGLAPACAGSRPIEGELYPIEQIDIIGMAGGVGCDVCGIIIGRTDRINVVLPPGRIILRQVGVQLSNGQVQAFQLSPPPGARAVSFKLPPPPAGTHYVSTKVTVW
jgi:hypothetical protein